MRNQIIFSFKKRRPGHLTRKEGTSDKTAEVAPRQLRLSGQNKNGADSAVPGDVHTARAHGGNLLGVAADRTPACRETATRRRPMKRDMFASSVSSVSRVKCGTNRCGAVRSRCVGIARHAAASPRRSSGSKITLAAMQVKGVAFL